MISDIDDVAIATSRRLFGGRFEGRQIKILGLRTQLKHAPNPDSRVTLSTERDSLGTKRVRLDLRFTGIEKRSLMRGLEMIGQELGRAGLGRVRLPDNLVSFTDGGRFDSGHHMGTTRMHLNPKKGVVDENCKMHGISNLFIASSDKLRAELPSLLNCTLPKSPISKEIDLGVKVSFKELRWEAATYLPFALLLTRPSLVR